MCETCGREIRVMCQVGSGFCSQNCERAAKESESE
jgi:hypothetical protein